MFRWVGRVHSCDYVVTFVYFSFLESLLHRFIADLTI